MLEGWSRLLDLLLNLTKQQLIERSKCVYFEDGVSPIGKASDFTFALANLKGEILNTLWDSNVLEKPFTIQT